MNIIVTGATGFIGRVVVKKLIEKRGRVFAVSRNAVAAQKKLPNVDKIIEWRDPKKDPFPQGELKGIDAVIHLAGERVASGRWTDEKKQEIFESRVTSTRNLISALKAQAVKPKTFISASALGFYGDRGDEILKESSAPGEGFLAHACQCWENEAIKAKDLGIRTSIVRIGVVVGSGGGILEKTLPIFSKGLGGPLGNGRQWISWIHIEDLANIVIHLLENEKLEGIFNGSAPYPVTNKEFTSSLGKVLGKPAILPAPSLALKLIYGEFGGFLLESNKLSSEKIIHSGFHFQYPDLFPALKQILKKKNPE